jgi:hypothetical protein
MKRYLEAPLSQKVECAETRTHETRNTKRVRTSQIHGELVGENVVKVRRHCPQRLPIREFLDCFWRGKTHRAQIPPLMVRQVASVKYAMTCHARFGKVLP